MFILAPCIGRVVVSRGVNEVEHVPPVALLVRDYFSFVQLIGLFDQPE